MHGTWFIGVEKVGSEEAKRLRTTLLAALTFVVLFIVALSVLANVSPSRGVSRLGLPCPFLNITGVPCPLCGLTRSLLSLVQRDLTRAFSYNPFGPAIWTSTATLAALSIGLSLFQRRLVFRLPRAVALPSITISILLLWTGNILYGHQVEDGERTAIRRVLEEQVQAWNEGDIERYIEGYWKSDSLIFTSGGKVSRGWKTTLERYKKSYATRDLMGTLSFSNLEIYVLDAATAWALGKWKLSREKDAPHGVFTLVLRRFPEGWRIIHDHTSLEP